MSLLPSNETDGPLIGPLIFNGTTMRPCLSFKKVVILPPPVRVEIDGANMTSILKSTEGEASFNIPLPDASSDGLFR